MSSRRSVFAGFRRTARAFLKSKIGIIGLVVIIFYCSLAILAPLLTSNDPIYQFNVAAPYSVPAWATYLPWYHGLAVTGNPIPFEGFGSQSALSSWILSPKNLTYKISSLTNVSERARAIFPGVLLVNASLVSNPSIANAKHPYQHLPYGQVYFSITRTFQWTSNSPHLFVVSAYVEPLKMVNVSQIYANWIISGPSGNFSLSTIKSYVISGAVDYKPNELGTWVCANVSSGALSGSSLPAFTGSLDAAGKIFSKQGTYALTLQIQAVPTSNNTSISLGITGIGIHVLGSAYGLLGTDNYGRDVWSQFVWGSRISLAVGILAGIGSVALGTIFGLSAGYLGGLWDEALSRVTDFFLVIPFLPLLIVAVFVINANAFTANNVYTWVIILLVILSWPSIARIIRSQTLTVKERSYVEASRALGAGRVHIIRKHILPNVMGLIYSQVALNVSGFILLEAALDFLQVSIRPLNTITWGAMLTYALPDATTNATASYVWWWFFPPGIAIATLSLAFVLVGFALDSVFNPKLRAR